MTELFTPGPSRCSVTCAPLAKRTPSWNWPISRRVKVTSSSAITPQAFWQLRG